MKQFLTIAFLIVVANATAQTNYFSINGSAIRGYDAVAYFNENKPVEGSKAFSYKWEGTEWLFKDKTNLDLFKANPEKYAPQFGGYCAYGVSEDHKSPTEPDAFTIVNDKLYLNYNKKVKEEWAKDCDTRIKRAEMNWPTLKHRDQYNLEDGLAIEGYDPVAYFSAGKPVKGKKEFKYDHEGATYYFSSAANKDAFVKNPAAYEPQYGGWCAYAMGETGEKVEVDPETFKVFEGKLYLFYNAYFNNTLPKWNKNEMTLKNKADKNWNAIIK